ncbi:MAG: hypothetical protein LAO19_20880 [Acidobacteriia bacterium]|nr:hypothetical protein [Terriglobia bacterium]
MFTCRECESDINQGTEICPQCGADLTAPPAGAEAPPAKPGLKKILIRWGVLLSVLLAAIWSFLWFVVPERQGDPTAAAEHLAVQSLQEVHAALSEYAAAEGGAYPRQFDALGDRGRGAAQLSQSASYQLQYTPGPVEADGRIRTYTLQDKAGNYGFRNFFADESGVLRATRENRAATAQDPPY